MFPAREADLVTAAIPIAAVTSPPEFLRREGCGVDAVLTKPCQMDMLAAARLFVGRMSVRES